MKKKLRPTARKVLLTPGPVTTTDTVKSAQVVPDICPREREFGALLGSVSRDLTKIARGGADYVTVLLTASGTAAVEAAISSVVPPGKSMLVINNGAYAERMVKIARALGIDCPEVVYEWDKEIRIADVEKQLSSRREIACVAMVHHETSTGRLNPVKEIGAITGKYNKTFIVDAISSFGGIPVDMRECSIDFMISAANKCLQGMPGFSFVICNKDELLKTKDYPERSFYLNLYRNYEYFSRKHQTPFTPAVQAVYALRQALDELLKEGLENRHKRYLKNWETLARGMKRLGFRTALDDELQSRLLTAFAEPDAPQYDFNTMHDLLKKQGFTIYPGMVGAKKTFRLGNIGAIDYRDIEAFLSALKKVMRRMDFKI